MRIGIIGLGRVGRMHAGHLATTAGVDEVVFCGRSAARVERARNGITAAAAPTAELTVATDLDRQLPDLDGVVIATPTDTHVDLVLGAARAGVPMLVEKPLALATDDIRRTADAVDALGVEVMVAFHRRYDAGYQALRAAVQDDTLGTVRTAHAVDHDFKQVPFDYVPGSGGIFRDLLVHDLDIVPWVLDDRPVALHALAGVLEEPEFTRLGDVDTATVLLTMASGAQVTLTGGRRMGTGQDVRLTVYGSEATLSAGLDGATPVASTEPGVPAPTDRYETFVERFLPAFRREAEHFVGLVQGDRANLTPPRAGLLAMHLADCAAESARTGRPVEIGARHAGV